MKKYLSENRMSTETEISIGTTGRHETFTPRYGWLKKGFDQCEKDGNVFNASDAIELLGVGKNMVRSIRYWCLLFKLIERDDKTRNLLVTKLGRYLLNDNTGTDPYLEDPASLWLLHWQIFTPPYSALSWIIAFNYITLSNFDESELSESIILKSKEIKKNRAVSDNSYRKDSSCLLRMYSHRIKNDRNDIRCPFRDLGLIVPDLRAGGKKYQFSVSPKKSLPDMIFLASIFSFANLWFPNQKTLSLQKIVYGLNSPGIAFKLSETECGIRIDRSCKKLEGVSFVNSNGIRQIQFDSNPAELYQKCIELYYGESI